MKNRNDFGELLIKHNLTNKGVEIGVCNGDFSKIILSSWHGKLYMIDIWRKLDDSEYDDVSNKNYDDGGFKNTIINTEKYVDRAFMLRMRAEDAIDLFGDESLDFVYIDANHKYEYVKRDIEQWFPKVKIGGILAGHDYIKLDCYNKENYNKGLKNFPIYFYTDNTKTETFYGGIFGVNPAVDEFVEQYNYDLNLTDEFTATWWIIKNDMNTF